MGASQSRADDEKVFYNDTPIQFSQDVVNHLADHLASTETSPERQTTLDAHVRSRIEAELSRLRQEEEEVRLEIERALEKENLEKETEMAGEETAEDGGSGKIRNSAVLMGDLEEIRQKVERFQVKRELEAYESVKESREAVLKCYNNHPVTPLECWREVNAFKVSVAEVEQKYIDSLR